MIAQGFEGTTELVVEDHDTKDIRDLLLDSDGKYLYEVEKYCKSLKGLTDEEVCRKLYQCLRSNINYRADTAKEQKLKTPAALFYYKEGDCKSYSLFAGSCLRVLGIPYAYRLASFSHTDSTPTHVYVVANPGTRDQYIIDATLSRFNYEKTATYKQDENMLYLLNGPGDSTGYATFALQRYANRGRGGRMGGFIQDVFSGQLKKAVTVDTLPPGANTALTAQQDMPKQFVTLQGLQKQKQAIADDTTLSYADRKKKIDVVQKQQDAAITTILNDVRDVETYNKNNSAIVGLVKTAVSAIANAVAPGSGVIVSAVNNVSASTSSDNSPFIKSMIPFISDSFPFYQGDYKKQVAAKTTAVGLPQGRLILANPSSALQVAPAPTSSSAQTVKNQSTITVVPKPAPVVSTGMVNPSTNITPPKSGSTTLVELGAVAIAAYFIFK